MVNGKIKDQSPGTVINFANRAWIILDPSSGYLALQNYITGKVFDTDDINHFEPTLPSNIGWYLNNTFLNTFPEKDRESVIATMWGNNNISSNEGGFGNTVPSISMDELVGKENMRKVLAKVGMLSVSDWRKYSQRYGEIARILTPPTNVMRLRNGYGGSFNYSTSNSGALTYSTVPSSLPNEAIPTIYLDPNKSIINGTLVHNAIPAVNIMSPANNQTLYENDTFNIDGTVSDADGGNTVTVRYQIGAGTARAIKAFVSTGAAESFSKQLRFSGGNLYDGNTLIAENLTDGVAHTLKVWATDDQGGTSPIIERTFYVVPNRAPSLSVNTPVISGNIDNDEFEITGSYNDLDKNTTKVTYRINGGSSVQVAEGTGGDFNFKVKFGQLKVGLNSIVIEAIDSYGAKTSRTVKLNKNEVKTEQLKSTARFKIHPPLNTATGIVLWVRRDENLDLSASISMTQAAEAENFVQMANPRTAPLANAPGIVEDQFEYESATAADKIILQLDMQRSSLTANEKIYLLVGVID